MQACSSSPAALKIEDKQDIALLKEIRRAKVPTFSLDGDIIVQPVLRTRKGNEFVAPATVDEVADYLQKHPKATIVAGSTEIDLVSQAYPDFAEVLRRFGSPPIRSTATLAGNIANGSPIGDSMPCLLALGATLTLRKGDKTREVKLENFYTGMKKSVLAEGEFIETVVIPQPATGSTFRAHKISKRFDQDISATVCAMNFELVNGKFKNVKLAYNGLSPYPSRAPKLEAIIEGNTPANITNDALDAAITSSFPARDGLRATWAYRSLVARNLVMQFIEETTQSTSNVKEAA